MRLFLIAFFTTVALAKDVYWVLAGDSTTATDGGWGDAFLQTTVANGSSGRNYGKSGRTTRSFRADGHWGNVINDVHANKQKFDVFVTIQFGHNDQKEGSGVSLSDYKSNLALFASETMAAGGTPILLTPLTRRRFDSKTGKVVENLSDQRLATIDVATQNRIKWVDLTMASVNYVNAIGSGAASKYNYEPSDYTHLNPWGGVVFARIVSDLLVEKYPSEFEAVTKRNSTMTSLIKAGKPV